MTVEELKNNNLLLYRYLRGSWSHGIAIEGKSDYDYGGCFITPEVDLYGLRSNYIEQVADEKNDEVYYELGRWFELLLKSNPTALESLYIDKEFVIGEVHPAIQKVIDNRDLFLTKEAFNPLLGYSYTQIKKASGYNKKCNYPEDMERKGVLDFCYVPYKQGSMKVVEWLERFGMKQKYCGLVALPNMHDTYGLYYDWLTHLICEFGVDLRDFNSIEKFSQEINNNSSYARLKYGLDVFAMGGCTCFRDFLNKMYNGTPYGFTGIVNENEDSNEVRICTVPKDMEPLIIMTYNKSGYESQCRDYKEWSEWKKNRNQIRYIDNKGYNYDAKNMCECVRLIHTGIELARGDGFNVKRTWDRDFLLDIKGHKYTYDELIKYITEKKSEFDEIVKTCKLPDTVDYDKINQLLINIRNVIYK